MQRNLLAAAELEGAANPSVGAGHEELVDRVIFGLEGRRLHAAADRPQLRTAFRQQVTTSGGKPKSSSATIGSRARTPRGLIQFMPERIRPGEQPYFVGFPEDEVIVRIRSDATRAAAALRRASASSLRR